ncbi:DUF6083 domain-containing protein [Streptomyces buecherae]|uniref:DUF6083 domain-containing protein n=1 Tax=Streptomyces buecherae TaxID=2763006 RepID=UPI001E5F5B3E|nr:DUF6083 domain-containing protein [Streptomyces buecherae]
MASLTAACRLTGAGPCAARPPLPAVTGRAAPASSDTPARCGCATSPSRLLRAGQAGRCRQSGNRIDLYQRVDQRPLALHPAELAAADVPEPCRWYLSSGIAYPHGDGSIWSASRTLSSARFAPLPAEPATTSRRCAASSPSVPAA